MRTLIAVSAILFLVSSVQAEEHSHHKPPTFAQYSGEYAVFMRQMDSDMEKMMHNMHSPGYSGDPDIDFLTMMIPHHQGAIDMSRLQLIYGKDPLIRKLAEEIIAGQRVEVEAMKRRLEILRTRKVTEGNEFPALGGTRGANPKGPGKEDIEFQKD
jgi:uncharacterized protein (DUF305 family)